jgi:predicted transcriptional regulator
MCQQQIQNILEKEKDWIDSESIANKMRPINTTGVRRALKKMYFYREILRKKIKTDRGGISFVYKLK